MFMRLLYLITDANKAPGAAKEIKSYIGCSASDLVLVEIVIIIFDYYYLTLICI